MNRRSFLGSIAVIGGSLLVGRSGNQQAVVQERREIPIEVTANGDFIMPGFFTVFVDEKESFRMVVGDSIDIERNCHIVAYKGFETTPTHNMWLFPGDSLTIYS